MMRQNLDFGDGKNGEKVYGKRGKKYSFNKLLIIIIVFCILKQDFSFTMTWLWLLAANVSPLTSISTAHKNYCRYNWLAHMPKISARVG